MKYIVAEHWSIKGKTFYNPKMGYIGSFDDYQEALIAFYDRVHNSEKDAKVNGFENVSKNLDKTDKLVEFWANKDYKNNRITISLFEAAEMPSDNYTRGYFYVLDHSKASTDEEYEAVLIKEFGVDNQTAKCLVTRWKEAKEPSVWRITKEAAAKAAKMAYECAGYGTNNSSGFVDLYVCKGENEDYVIDADIWKTKFDDREYFTIIVRFSEDESDFEYTNSLSVDELAAKLVEIAENCG